nr:DapH/DapD/GlmU-related protein [Thermovirga lienii]
MIPIIRLIGYIIYDNKYLTGKWFEVYNTGWKWVLRGLWYQKILGFNRNIPFPVCPFTKIMDYRNIHFNNDDLNNFQSPGCYFQCGKGHIYIGHGTYIRPNVGIITANHNPYNLDEHLSAKDVVIGEKCWIGMNSVILPGVILGNQTIVAAGSVVTKSFPGGKCVIGGVPAKLIKEL